MANYECVTRSNNFRVKDPEAFRKFMSRVYGSNKVNLWEQKDKEDRLVFGFGLFGGIGGYASEETADDDDLEEYTDYDVFLDGLQKHIAADDAIIIVEGGNESLRYIIGSAVVVTRNAIEYFDVTNLATRRAAELLENPQWTTKCNY